MFYIILRVAENHPRSPPITFIIWINPCDRGGKGIKLLHVRLDLGLRLTCSFGRIKFLCLSVLADRMNFRLSARFRIKLLLGLRTTRFGLNLPLA